MRGIHFSRVMRDQPVDEVCEEWRFVWFVGVSQFRGWTWLGRTEAENEARRWWGGHARSPSRSRFQFGKMAGGLL